MLTFEESEAALAKMVDDLPPEILKGLNCGVILLPDTIFDNDGLLILGRYYFEPMGLGRYVTVHYGSLVKACGYLSVPKFTEKIKDVLHHELVHHLEHQAGDRSLEIQDAIDRNKYLRRRYAPLKQAPHLTHGNTPHDNDSQEINTPQHPDSHNQPNTQPGQAE